MIKGVNKDAGSFNGITLQDQMCSLQCLGRPCLHRIPNKVATEWILHIIPQLVEGKNLSIYSDSSRTFDLKNSVQTLRMDVPKTPQDLQFVKNTHKQPCSYKLKSLYFLEPNWCLNLSNLFPRCHKIGCQTVCVTELMNILPDKVNPHMWQANKPKGAMMYQHLQKPLMVFNRQRP